MGLTKFRFSIGESAQERATDWGLSIQEKSVGEIETYFYGRATGGEVKASFHNSGKCHVGFIKKFYDAHKSRMPECRHFDEWNYRESMSDGVSVLFHVLTLPEVVRKRSRIVKKELQIIPKPDPGKVRLTSLFMIEDGFRGKIQGERLVNAFERRLTDGRKLGVLSAEIPRPIFSDTPPLKARQFGNTALSLNSDDLIAFAGTTFEGWGFNARAIVELPVAVAKSEQ